MKNLESVFAAYAIGWAVFFLFYLSVAKRTSDLRAEVARLKEIVGRKAEIRK
jgi:hypothetical protein